MEDGILCHIWQHVKRGLNINPNRLAFKQYFEGFLIGRFNPRP